MIKNVFMSSITILLVMNLIACSEKKDSQATVNEATATQEQQDIIPVATSVADKVFLNGKIITVNDQQPKAQVVAVKNGLITYVGDLRGAKPLMGENTQKIDLRGLTMVPGFVDAHGHVVSAGLQAASANLLPLPDGQVNSFSDLSDTLTAWKLTKNGQTFITKTGWLVGFGFDDSQLKEQQAYL